MKKVFLLFVVAGFLSFPALSSSYGPYSLIAPTAVDGDTIRADVLIWPGQIADAAIRIVGVDTPELTGAKCDAEKAKAVAARDFVNAWLSSHHPITINTVRPDKYSGRVDAVVLGRNGELLAADLIKAGHGRPYRGGARQPWCPQESK